MTDKVAGGCLCGNVRFETAATPAAQVLCFCTDCQHISGSMCHDDHKGRRMCQLLGYM